MTFLAGSVLPFPSETFLLFLLKKGIYPVWVLLTIAVFGNSLGAVLNYYLGRGGSHFLFKKFYNIDKEKIEKIILQFKKYGVVIIFFSFVPVVGDPLTVVAGILKIPFAKFLLIVIFGKFFRFLILSGIFVKIFE